MKKKIVKDVIFHAVMIILALIWIYPYAWMFISSFKVPNEIFGKFIPSKLTLEHYKFIFFMSKKLERPFIRAFLNSVFISTVVTFSVMFFSSLIAYPLSKLKFGGGKAVFNFIIFQMLFPGFIFNLHLIPVVL